MGVCLSVMNRKKVQNDDFVDVILLVEAEILVVENQSFVLNFVDNFEYLKERLC